jgi:hypothetical protein
MEVICSSETFSSTIWLITSDGEGLCCCLYGMYPAVHWPLLGCWWDKNLLELLRVAMRSFVRRSVMSTGWLSYQHNHVLLPEEFLCTSLWPTTLKQGSGDTNCHEFLLVVTVSGDSAELCFPAICRTLIILELCGALAGRLLILPIFLPDFV